LPDASPPLRPEDLRNPDLPYWRSLMAPEGEGAGEGEGEGERAGDPDAPAAVAPEGELDAQNGEEADALGTPATPAPTRVASPSDVEALLGALDDEALALPDDDSAFLNVADDDLGEDDVNATLPGLVIGATLAETMGIQLG